MPSKPTATSLKSTPKRTTSKQSPSSTTTKPLTFKSPHRTDYDVNVVEVLEQLAFSLPHGSVASEFTYGEMGLAMEAAANFIKSQR
jgi:hypothetical protein